MLYPLINSNGKRLNISDVYDESGLFKGNSVKEIERMSSGGDQNLENFQTGRKLKSSSSHRECDKSHSTFSNETRFKGCFVSRFGN